MSANLTEKQRAFVAFWHDFALQHGFPPTIREACKAFGYKSTNAANCMLRSLEASGVVLTRRRAGKYVTDATPDRVFVVLFDGDRFTHAIEAASAREARAICFGYGFTNSYGEGVLYSFGDVRGFEDEMYLSENYPADEVQKARECTQCIAALPRLPGRHVDSAQRITVETWGHD